MLIPEWPGAKTSLRLRGDQMSRLPLLGLLLLLTVTLSGCELVGDVLEFGLWAVLIVVILVVALVVWLFKKVF